MYLALCIASHLAPSPADLKNGALGGVFLATLTLAAVWLVSSCGWSLAFLDLLYIPLGLLVVGVALLQLLYVAVVAVLYRSGVI